MPTVTVRQRKDENPNVALMHIGLITGTPVHPKLAFSVNLLELFYHLRRRQPNIGIQGFVKATCAFQQVCFPPYVSPQITNYPCCQVKYNHSMEQLFSQAFDVFSDLQRRLQKRVDTALGRDGPDWSMRYSCPACGFEVSSSLHSMFQSAHFLLATR